MTCTTSAEVYEHYRELCGGTQVLREDELRYAIREAGLRYEEVDDAFWTMVFRRPDHRHLT